MKKRILVSTLCFALLTAHASFAGSDEIKPIQQTEVKQPSQTANLSKSELKQLAKRYQEIEKMNMSMLSSQEQTELKAEQSDIKTQLQQQEGVYLYLSGTAILIIILLIILL